MTYRSRHPVWVGLLAVLLGVFPALAATTARSTADRVSVRSRAGFAGEVMTRLAKGQEVEVLGGVMLTKPATNEPAAWVRVALPAATPLWVTAEHVDAASKTVTADVLNARAGPGWDYASVGRLKKGTVLRARGEVKDGWLEIEAPAGSYGFVQAAFLEPASAGAPASAAATPDAAAKPAKPARTKSASKGKPGSTPAPSTANPVPAPPITAGPPAPLTVKVVDEPVAVTPAPGAKPASTRSPAPAAPASVPPARATASAPPTPPAAAGASVPAPVPKPVPATAPRTNAPVAPAVPVAPVAAPVAVPGPASGAEAEAGAPETIRARWVRREGLVIRPFNIQAPTYYGLKALDSGKTVNFLFTTRSEPINWREYRGKVVIVTGREYLDARYFWQNTPLLDVETVEAVR